jgi:hypothetical protein
MRAELHPDFPAAVWAVVEQPPGEERRLKYDPNRQASCRRARRR